MWLSKYQMPMHCKAFPYSSSLIPAVAPRKRGVALCFSAGMVFMALTMQVCIAFQVLLSLSWPRFMSEMPAPAERKPKQKQSQGAQSFLFHFCNGRRCHRFAFNSGLPAESLHVLLVPLGVLPKYPGFQTHANKANWHLLPWPVRANLCLPLLSSDKEPGLTRDSTVNFLRHHPRFILLLAGPLVHVDGGT